MKTLWPRYAQSIDPRRLQLVRGRVNKLSERLSELDERRDRVVELLRSEKLAVDLHTAFVAGVEVFDAVRQSANSSNIGDLLHWYLRVCQLWQAILDLPPPK